MKHRRLYRFRVWLQHVSNEVEEIVRLFERIFWILMVTILSLSAAVLVLSKILEHGGLK
jgi:hypothetical protein